MRSRLVVEEQSVKVELASRLGKQRLFVAAGGIYRCFDSQHSALVVVAYTSPRETDLQHFCSSVSSLPVLGKHTTWSDLQCMYTGETQRQSQIYYNFEETNSSPQVHRKHTQLFMALTRKAAMDIGQSSQML